MEEVNLRRQVFNKDKFNETVDTTFSQLVDNTPAPVFDINLATVEDFFTLYDNFFFEIPKEGDINSHRFLFKESGDYINAELINEEIQALLQEIVELRQEQITGLQIADGNDNTLIVDRSTLNPNENAIEVQLNQSQLNTLNI